MWNSAMERRLGRLLLEDYWRPANSFRLQRDSYLDAVGYLDEGNAAIHPVVFAVERHRPSNLTRGFPFAFNR
jgi:hypothetical protein